MIAVLGAVLASGPVTGVASAADQGPAYALVHGCFGLRSEEAGKLLVQAPDGGWKASAGEVGGAEPFRMQATDLGRYLLYGKDADFLSGAGGTPGTAPEGSTSTDWKVEAQDGGAFRLTLPALGRGLVAAADGTLSLVPAGEATGSRSLFTFVPAEGCAIFPEIETGVSGAPSKGSTPYGETRGFVDAHLHHMAFEFLGGKLHCGRPWHPYGVTKALPDCNENLAEGTGTNIAGTVLGAQPTTDQVGWPTFNSWPAYNALAHEGTYWKWMERAWASGLRLYVNLLVDNAVLCEVYPFKNNNCNEMDTVRLQIRRINELQDYIDAQNGGPGKGWFRIVRDPAEARRVINDGKLAVVLGIEVSKLFDCGIYNDQPTCDRAQIDRQLNEMHRAGVRQMELVNKFDNALSGVAGDSGETGVVVNSANKLETGKFWDMQTCTGDGHDHDREQITLPGMERDALIGAVFGALVPAGQVPLYPEAPHCNTRGLTPLGAFLVRRMVEKGMLFDPDHMSVVARDQALSVIEANDYSGVLSSHSWSDPSSIPRIYKQGGFVTPYAGGSTGFVKEWRETRKHADPRYYFGFGFGADMNGFGTQGGPRANAAENPVEYPFKSFDGKQTLTKQRSGVRTYDINADGVAHYGLYPDWIEDLRKIAGPQIIEDMARGAEAYLQMWERAEGIKADSTRPKGSTFSPRALGAVRVGDRPQALLERAGQPVSRKGRTWSFRVAGAKNRKARVRAVFTSRGRVGMVTSTASSHRAAGLGVGTRASRVAARTVPFGTGIRARRLAGGRTYLYGVRTGRVRWVAVTATSVGKSPKLARSYLRRAGLR